MLRVELLGGLRIGDDPRRLVGRPAALLAILALTPRVPQTRGKLAVALWPDADSAAARNNLSVALHALRKSIPDAIEADAASVTLQVSTDLEALEAALSTGDFESAVTLFRGILAPELEVPALDETSDRLLLNLIQGAENQVAIHRKEGRLDEAWSLNSHVLRLDPLNERAHKRNVRLLSDLKRPAEARTAYDAYARMVRAHYNSEPDPALRPAEESPAAAQTRRTAFTGRARIPVRLTRFFGRTRELELIKQMLGRPLITITGMGGMGKTRLAEQALSEAAKEGQPFVAFVPLAQCQDHVAVLSEISQAVAPNSGEVSLSAIIHGVPEGPALIVLDNVESLMIQNADSITDLLHELIGALPNVTWLVTSRTALRIEGEVELHLEPFPAPKGLSLEELEANTRIRLFVDRAQAAKPDFVLSERNAASVAQVVQWLDGVPLAIELAAACIKTLPPNVMTQRLRDRLDVPASKYRNTNERHRTLSAVLDTSHELLSTSQASLLADLSVFSGSFDHEAINAVCGSAEEVDHLVRASLVEATETGSGMRYHLLGLVRDYAAARRLPNLPERHAAHFLSLSETVRSNMRRGIQANLLAATQEDHANHLAALDYLLEHRRAVESLRYVSSLWRFWSVQGLINVGRPRLEQALALVEADNQQDVRSALADALNAAGNMAYSSGDYAASKQHHERSLALRREAQDWRGIASSLNNLGLGSLRTEEFAEGKMFCEEGLAVCSLAGAELDDLTGLLTGTLGLLAIGESEYAQAVTCFTKACDIFRSQENAYALANNERHLAVALWNLEQRPDAQTVLKTALDSAHALNSGPLVLSILLTIASFAVSSEPESSRGLLDAVRDVRMASNVSYAPGDAHVEKQLLTELQPVRTTRLDPSYLQRSATDLLERICHSDLGAERS